MYRPAADYQAAFCLIDAALPELKEMMHLLHPVERDHYETFAFDKRRTSYLLGRLAAKHAVAQLTGHTDLSRIRIDAGVFQYPVVSYLGDTGIQVSISHCGNLGLAVAFPEAHPIGVDLEIIQESNVKALGSQLTKREKSLLSAAALPQAMGYTMLWTAKEAFSKVLRTGLTMDLKLFEIKSIQQTDLAIKSEYRNSIQYKAISHCCGDHVVSLVLPERTEAGLDAFRQAFEACIRNSGAI